MARTKWRIVYPGSPELDEFRSERATYDFVQSLRNTYELSLRPPSALYDPVHDPTVVLTVQVDEGFGWQWFEDINFAEEH